MSKWLGLREDQVRAQGLISIITRLLPEPPRYRARPGNRSRAITPAAESPASKGAG
ncbi:hypothetical protein SAMN05216593_106128 [Pseudomonas asturiensis]|uniref:Uncharacterized protein n=1 Tax=Pseudomonas asturiensis TaxID=1190415 RepID=A0A1M7NJL8_9PSED|nr:hypothetical protein SAMN05216593_106128 [Pseudomonas asturiensis]